MTSTSTFNPRGLLKDRHFQTLFNSIGPRRWRSRKLQQLMASETLLLSATDGTRLVAEFDSAADHVTAARTRHSLAILLHGWEGSSRSAYQVTTAQHLLSLGFDVLRLNFRDHGPSHHLNRQLFNSTRTSEVADAIADFLTHSGHRYHRRVLAGYSLGGNFALRIAADRGSELGLDAVIAVCPPVDPANAMAALNSGWFVYERYFFRKWARSLRHKLVHFPDLGYGPALAKAATIEDLNRFFVPNHTEFDHPDAYFNAYSLAGDRLARLQLPGYLIASADDPIIPVTDLSTLSSNPMLHVDIQSHGGHCGFATNLRGDSWVEQRIGQICVDADSAVY